MACVTRSHQQYFRVKMILGNWQCGHCGTLTSQSGTLISTWSHLQAYLIQPIPNKKYSFKLVKYCILLFNDKQNSQQNWKLQLITKIWHKNIKRAVLKLKFKTDSVLCSLQDERQEFYLNLIYYSTMFLCKAKFCALQVAQMWVLWSNK